MSETGSGIASLAKGVKNSLYRITLIFGQISEEEKFKEVLLKVFCGHRNDIVTGVLFDEVLLSSECILHL